MPKVYEVIQEKIEASIKEKGVVVDKIIRGLMSFSGFVRKNFGINIGKILFKSINKQVFGGKMTGLGTGASPCKKETASFFLNLGYNWADFTHLQKQEFLLLLRELMIDTRREV